MFGDHTRRSAPPFQGKDRPLLRVAFSPDIAVADFQPEYYRSPRPYQHPGPLFGPPRHAENPEPGRYYAEQRRIWIPGPHAQSEQRYHIYEDRRETREDRRGSREDRRETKEAKRRRFTRFSPPTSPGNTLALDLAARPPSGRTQRFEHTETESNASVTVTNVEGPSASASRQTLAQRRERRESIAPREKFFAGLARTCV